MFNEKEYQKQWRQKNKEYFKNYQKKYRQKISKEKKKEYQSRWNKKNKEYFKLYHQRNKEKIKILHNNWYQRNRKKIRLRHQIYHQKNREKLLKQHKKYYQKNREKRKQYRQRNKEKIARQCKKYYQENKERCRMIGRISSVKRRILLEKIGPLTIERIQKVYEDNIKRFGTLTCYLCFIKIKFGEDSLDHKTPLSRGGGNQYKNLGIVHFICNCRKYNKTEKEYREEMKSYARK